MNGNHATILLGHVLAPAPSKTHAVSLTQYAMSSWSPGAWLLLAVIVMVAVFVLPRIARSLRG